jgi:hypothetical protein
MDPVGQDGDNWECVHPIIQTSEELVRTSFYDDKVDTENTRNALPKPPDGWTPGDSWPNEIDELDLPDFKWWQRKYNYSYYERYLANEDDEQSLDSSDSRKPDYGADEDDEQSLDSSDSRKPDYGADEDDDQSLDSSDSRKPNYGANDGGGQHENRLVPGNGADVGGVQHENPLVPDNGANVGGAQRENRNYLRRLEEVAKNDAAVARGGQYGLFLPFHIQNQIVENVEIQRQRQRAQNAGGATRQNRGDLVVTQAAWDVHLRAARERDRVLKQFGAKISCKLGVLLEEMMEQQVLIACDWPKPNVLGKWVKKYYAIARIGLYDALLSMEWLRGGPVYDECMLGNKHMPMVYDVEIKRVDTSLFDNNEERYRNVFGIRIEDTLFRCAGPLLSTEDNAPGDVELKGMCMELADLYKRICIENFTNEECRAGYEVTKNHICLMLFNMLLDRDNIDNERAVLRNVGNQLNEMYHSGRGDALRITSGCRSKKFSLHVTTKYIHVDGIDLSAPVIAYETARHYTKDNICNLLIKHYDQWFGKTVCELSPETRFRIRSLMIEGMLHPPRQNVEPDTLVEEVHYKGFNDTMFDECIYEDKHMLRGPFANKAKEGGLPLIPVEAFHGRSIMVDVSQSQLPSMNNYEKLHPSTTGQQSVFNWTHMPFESWCDHTVSCHNQLSRPTTHVLFGNLDGLVLDSKESTYPKLNKLKQRRNRAINQLSNLRSQFWVVRDSKLELFVDPRNINHRRRTRTHEPRDNIPLAEHEIQTDPYLVVKMEDGMSLIFAYII